jgi:hypothetical protein
MTEAEWLASVSPADMLRHLTEITCEDPIYGGTSIHTRARPLVSDRKLRLFACASVRHVPSENRTAPAKRQTLRLIASAERMADGRPYRLSSKCWLLKPQGIVVAVNALGPFYDDDNRIALSLADHAIQASLLREVVGNPFRPPIVLDDEWLTPTVLKMARSAYNHHDWDALPVLADALEDAGCPLEWCPHCGHRPKLTRCEYTICVAHNVLLDAHPLLHHLRGPGPHVRGCWALDLILGKS